MWFLDEMFSKKVDGRKSRPTKSTLSKEEPKNIEVEVKKTTSRSHSSRNLPDDLGTTSSKDWPTSERDDVKKSQGYVPAKVEPKLKEKRPWYRISPRITKKVAVKSSNIVPSNAESKKRPTSLVLKSNVTSARGQNPKLEGDDLSRTSSVTNLEADQRSSKGAKPRKTPSRDRIDKIVDGKKNEKKGLGKNNNKLDSTETPFLSLDSTLEEGLQQLKRQLQEMAQEKTDLALQLGEKNGQVNFLQKENYKLKALQEECNLQLEKLSEDNTALRNRLRDVAHSPLSDNEKQQLLFESHRHHNSAPASIAANIIDDANGADTTCTTPDWDKHSSGNISEVSVACLQDKINQMQETHYSTNEELQATLQELTDLQMQLTELRQENERLNDEKTLMFDSLCRQTERLNDSREEVESLKQHLYQEKDRGEFEAAAEREQKLVDLLHAAQEERATLLAKVEQLNVEVRDVGDGAADKTERLEQARERVGTLECALDAKHAELKQLEQELAQARDQCSGKQIEINRLTDLLDNARTKIVELEQDRTLSDKSELDELLDNARKEKDSLESEVAHLKEQLAISRNEIEKLKEQVSVLQEECKVTRNNAKTTQSDMEYKSEMLLKEKNAMADQLQEFQEALNELQVQSQCQLEDKRQLSAVLSETQRNLSEAERKHSKLEQEFEELKKTRDEENEEWEKFQDDLLTSVRVANDFKTEAQQELQRLILENKSCRERERQLKAEIEKLKGSAAKKKQPAPSNMDALLKRPSKNRDRSRGSSKTGRQNRLKTLSVEEETLLRSLRSYNIDHNVPEANLTEEERAIKKLKIIFEDDFLMVKPVAPKPKHQLAISKPLVDSVLSNPKLLAVMRDPKVKTIDRTRAKSHDYGAVTERISIAGRQLYRTPEVEDLTLDASNQRYSDFSLVVHESSALRKNDEAKDLSISRRNSEVGTPPRSLAALRQSKSCDNINFVFAPAGEASRSSSETFSSAEFDVVTGLTGPYDPRAFLTARLRDLSTLSGRFDEKVDSADTDVDSLTYNDTMVLKRNHSKTNAAADEEVSDQKESDANVSNRVESSEEFLDAGVSPSNPIGKENGAGSGVLDENEFVRILGRDSLMYNDTINKKRLRNAGNENEDVAENYLDETEQEMNPDITNVYTMENVNKEFDETIRYGVVPPLTYRRLYKDVVKQIKEKYVADDKPAESDSGDEDVLDFFKSTDVTRFDSVEMRKSSTDRIDEDMEYIFSEYLNARISGIIKQSEPKRDISKAIPTPKPRQIDKQINPEMEKPSEVIKLNQTDIVTRELHSVVENSTSVLSPSLQNSLKSPQGKAKKDNNVNSYGSPREVEEPLAEEFRNKLSDGVKVVDSSATGESSNLEDEKPSEVIKSNQTDIVTRELHSVVENSTSVLSPSLQNSLKSPQGKAKRDNNENSYGSPREVEEPLAEDDVKVVDSSATGDSSNLQDELQMISPQKKKPRAEAELSDGVKVVDSSATGESFNLQDEFQIISPQKKEPRTEAELSDGVKVVESSEIEESSNLQDELQIISPQKEEGPRAEAEHSDGVKVVESSEIEESSNLQDKLQIISPQKKEPRTEAELSDGVKVVESSEIEESSNLQDELQIISPQKEEGPRAEAEHSDGVKVVESSEIEESSNLQDKLQIISPPKKEPRTEAELSDGVKVVESSEIEESSNLLDELQIISPQKEEGPRAEAEHSDGVKVVESSEIEESSNLQDELQIISPQKKEPRTEAELSDGVKVVESSEIEESSNLQDELQIISPQKKEPRTEAELSDGVKVVESSEIEESSNLQDELQMISPQKEDKPRAEAELSDGVKVVDSSATEESSNLQDELQMISPQKKKPRAEAELSDGVKVVDSSATGESFNLQDELQIISPQNEEPCTEAELSDGVKVVDSSATGESSNLQDELQMISPQKKKPRAEAELSDGVKVVDSSATGESFNLQDDLQIISPQKKKPRAEVELSDGVKVVDSSATGESSNLQDELQMISPQKEDKPRAEAELSDGVKVVDSSEIGDLEDESQIISPQKEEKPLAKAELSDGVKVVDSSEIGESFILENESRNDLDPSTTTDSSHQIDSEAVRIVPASTDKTFSPNKSEMADDLDAILNRMAPTPRTRAAEKRNWVANTEQSRAPENPNNIDLHQQERLPDENQQTNWTSEEQGLTVEEVKLVERVKQRRCDRPVSEINENDLEFIKTMSSSYLCAPSMRPPDVVTESSVTVCSSGNIDDKVSGTTDDKIVNVALAETLPDGLDEGGGFGKSDEARIFPVKSDDSEDLDTILNRLASTSKRRNRAPKANDKDIAKPQPPGAECGFRGSLGDVATEDVVLRPKSLMSDGPRRVKSFARHFEQLSAESRKKRDPVSPRPAASKDPAGRRAVTSSDGSPVTDDGLVVVKMNENDKLFVVDGVAREKPAFEGERLVPPSEEPDAKMEEVPEGEEVSRPLTGEIGAESPPVVPEKMQNDAEDQACGPSKPQHSVSSIEIAEKFEKLDLTRRSTNLDAASDGCASDLNLFHLDAASSCDDSYMNLFKTPEEKVFDAFAKKKRSKKGYLDPEETSDGDDEPPKPKIVDFVPLDGATRPVYAKEPSGGYATLERESAYQVLKNVPDAKESKRSSFSDAKKVFEDLQAQAADNKTGETSSAGSAKGGAKSVDKKGGNQ